MKRRKRTGIIAKIFLTLCIIMGIFAGGYFFLDKVIVPKYFSKYGINGMPDLVGVVRSLYNSPKESSLVTNGFTNSDLTSATDKLQSSGYKVEDDGTILNHDFNNFQGTEPVELTDKEIAAFCNKMLEDGVLASVLPNLNYINVMNISILEVIITPNKSSEIENGYSSANVEMIIKLNTTNIREQIANQMNTPLFLLNMIIPDTLYFTVSYDIDVSDEQARSNGTIAINGRTENQSKVLIGLLIEFIFPAEDEMNQEKFTSAIGDILVLGIDALGEFRFVSNLGANQKQSGIYVIPAVV